MSRPGLLLAFVLLASIPTHAAIIVSTYPNWDGGSAFAQMGEQPSIPATTATWGQTFQAPYGAPIINDFSFWLSDSPVFEPDPLKFRGYLMKWNGARATGPILYQSPTLTADGMAHGDFRRFDLGPMNLLLDPSQDYVMFMSCSALFDGVDSWSYVAGMPADNYPGGYLVTLNNQNNTAMWTSTDWQITGQWDNTFEATFALPEPTAALASLTFLLVVGLLRRARSPV